MRISNAQRRSMLGGGRGLSPNSFQQRGNPNVSVHSEHLWNMMEDVQLFPDEIYQLLRYEERNLSTYKKDIEKEKHKVGQVFDSLKKEMEHNIDDLKISVYAQLDRIYRNYMEKYANLKGQIMEIKRLKDQIEINIQSRNINYIPKMNAEDRSNSSGIGKYSSVSNNNALIIKAMEKNTIDAKKYQMSNYIAQLQREKIIPLGELGRELVILTKYENGYYQNKQFQTIAEDMLEQLKGSLRSIYERKYEFIREPEEICQKENKPILDELNEPNQYTPSLGNNYRSVPDRGLTIPVANMAMNNYTHPPPSMSMPVAPPSPRNIPVSNMYQPQGRSMGRLEETKFMSIAPEQQNITYEMAESVNLVQEKAIKNVASDIILCALEVARNMIAVGSKDGVITIYDSLSGQKMANLRGHKASICKLALVNNNGRKYLASGSDHGCSSIVLWDINTWNIRMKIQYHKAAVTAIVDLQDNRSLISGSYDKCINVYNLNDEGKMLFNLPANRASVTAVLMNCKGNKLITCGLDDTISVHQIMRNTNGQVDTMFLEREIQNNTMICSIVCSVINPELVFLGTKDGKVKLINIDRGEAYKIYNVCSNAVIELVVIERQTKPEYPLALCWPCGEECIKIVNTESGRINSQQVRGMIQFGCGIGPKSFFISSGRTLAMLSQSRQQQEVNLFRLDVSQ